MIIITSATSLHMSWPQIIQFDKKSNNMANNGPNAVDKPGHITGYEHVFMLRDDVFALK